MLRPRENRPVLTTVLVGVGLLGILCGILGAFILPLLFDYALKKELVIEEGSASYKAWQQTQIPAYISFYFFSLENDEEFSSGRGKPRLKEMGPYVFREEQEKVDIEWLHENASVSYKIKKHWFFEETLSQGTLADMITTVNVPAVGGVDATKDNVFMQWGYNDILEAMGTSLFIRRSVGDLLFDGFEDSLMSLANWVGADEGLPMDRFGWFYKRNGTSWADGTFNMLTGAGDVSKLGQIHTWNGLTQTNYEGNCGKIGGSAGGLFPPGVDDDRIALFSHDACRMLWYHEAGVDDVGGIPVTRYVMEETTFANSTVHPPNACFHNDLPTGLQNSTTCKVKSPTFLSFPHFHHADSSYLEQFAGRGLAPSEDRHGSLIAVEETSGLPLEFLLRLQINVRVEPVEGISMLKHLKEKLYLPALWFEVHFRAPPRVTRSFKRILSMPFIMRMTAISVAAVGCLLMGAGLHFCRRRRRGSSLTVSSSSSSSGFDEDSCATLIKT